MAVLPLFIGTGPAPWTTYLGVGVAIVVMGLIVFFWAGGLGHPTSGIVYGSFLLSLFLIVLGAATTVGAFGIRYRAHRDERLQ
jgi:hypothetical protein